MKLFELRREQKLYSIAITDNYPLIYTNTTKSCSLTLTFFYLEIIVILKYQFSIYYSFPLIYISLLNNEYIKITIINFRTLHFTLRIIEDSNSQVKLLLTFLIS